jgi:DNA-binding SARP family transcriptional activator/DNA-binding XRE family transcriptional regulator
MARRPGRRPPERMGPLVTRYRARRGLTQRELAVAAGVGLGTVRDLEQGRTRWPRWGTLESVAAALDVGQRERTELLRAWHAESDPAVGLARGCATFGPVRIDILGPLSAVADGTSVNLGPARQRALLGLLALSCGTCVHRDAIIDVLWRPSQPPPSALAQLQGYVWRLRTLLGSGQGGDREQLIATVGAGYALRADAGQLDVAAFRHLADAAEAAGRRSDEAFRLYEQALDIWRGEVLADIEQLRDHPAAIELAHRHAQVVMSHAEAAIRAAVPHRALRRLRDLCARDPFHEAAHAQLMIALAATGQQAAALEAFGRLRYRLRTELGISPGPGLSEAHAQILRQELRGGQRMSLSS